MIEEPVKKGLEIQNALSHFGVDYAFVDWKNNDFNNRIITKVGTVEGTTKVVSIIGFE